MIFKHMLFILKTTNYMACTIQPFKYDETRQNDKKTFKNETPIKL